MNRRQILATLLTVPAALRSGFSAPQIRPTSRHRVFLGGGHGLLLEPEGTLLSWSRAPTSGDTRPAENALGVGHNNPIDVYTLYPVANLKGVVSAAGGGGASYAVLADGRVFAWGINASGMLGNTPLAEIEERVQPRSGTNIPVPILGDINAMDVSATDHVLVLARDGSIYTWGQGDRGQLGIGPMPVINFRTRTPAAMTYMAFPVKIPNLTAVKAVSAGTSHSLALLEDGTVRAWGYNRMGQIGDGSTANRFSPVPVSGVRNAIAIAAGAYFSVAVLANGTVMEWGAEYDGTTPRPVPAVVAGARDIRTAVAGSSHVVGLTNAGTVVTWGSNAHYETGRGRNASAAPGLVQGISGAQSVASNHESSTVVLASGRIVTWGGVRKWTRPDPGGDGLSPFPILLWLDGLEQP